MSTDRSRCLDDYHAEGIIFMLRRPLSDFVNRSKYVKTIDSFLVILGTLVSEVEEVASVTGLNPEVVLDKVFKCDEVTEALKPLARYSSEVEHIVLTSPRHRKLRAYLPMIISYLSKLTPAPVELYAIRPSMKEIESDEVDSTRIVTKPSIVIERDRVYRGDLDKNNIERVIIERMKPPRRPVEETKKRPSKRTLAILLILIILSLLLISYYLDIEPISTLVDHIIGLVKGKNKELSISDIKMNVLNELNRIRIRHGLPPVKLMNSSIAQYRAEDMVRKKYFGHCDLIGLPTSYYYTFHGGVYAMEENIGLVSECIVNIPGIVNIPDPISSSEALEYALLLLGKMVYYDEASDWGHRDSLLDPTNNYVDIGIAWDKGVFILVLQMNKVWVSWSEPPKYVDNTFKACGRILLKNSEVTHVIIYKYKYDAPLETSRDIWNWLLSQSCRLVYETCSNYSSGVPVAGVIPPYFEGYYIGIETIIAKVWIQREDYFCIEFKWRPRESGIYTIMIFAKNTLNTLHPYDQDRYKQYLPILEYTFEYSG